MTPWQKQRDEAAAKWLNGQTEGGDYDRDDFGFLAGYDAGHAQAQAEIAVKESRESQFESTLSETMRQRDEARAEVERMDALAQDWQSKYSEAQEQAEKLEAEVQRLQEIEFMYRGLCK